jgi:NAD-dependent SIR2 family protein deacetylase
MDFDALLKQLQDWTNKVPLLVLGSGASVEFNLPSMWELGEHLKTSLTFEDDEDKKQFEEFKKNLDKEKDLEKALSKIQLNETVLKSVIKATWELISKEDLKAYERFIFNEEKVPLVILMEYLLSTTNKKLSIVTTNYDRIAEYSASVSKAFICTGYAHNYIGHFSDYIHTNILANIKGYHGQVNIWKVHGSLDWFETPNNKENVYLPLCRNIPECYKPLIVTPGLSKYAETHKEPYRTILAQAGTEIQNANGFLCIGYGFNDEYVQPKLIQQIKSKPIIVITKELTPKTKEAIIDGGCKNYILMEENGGNHTKVYSSSQGEDIIKNVRYWQLSEYLKLIK